MHRSRRRAPSGLPEQPITRHTKNTMNSLVEIGMFYLKWNIDLYEKYRDPLALGLRLTVIKQSRCVSFVAQGPLVFGAIPPGLVSRSASWTKGWSMWIHPELIPWIPGSLRRSPAKKRKDIDQSPVIFPKGIRIEIETSLKIRIENHDPIMGIFPWHFGSLSFTWTGKFTFKNCVNSLAQGKAAKAYCRYVLQRPV